MSLNQNVLAAISPWLRSELGIDHEQFGRLSGAAGLAGAAGALLLGPVVDRVGRRPPLLVGMVLFLLANAGYLFAASYGWLLTVRLVSGFVAGVVMTSAASAVADLVPYERRAAAMGIVTGAILLAVPIGMPIASVLAEAWTWRAVFAMQVIAAVFACIALFHSLPHGIGRAQVRTSPWSVVKRLDVLAALVSVVLYTGSFFAATQFVADWLHETGLLPRERNGLLWITLGVFAAFGSFAFGRIADRTGKRRFVLASTLVIAVGLAMLGRVDAMLPFAAIGIPIAAVSAARSAVLLALLSEMVPPQNRGTLMGVRAAANNLGTGTVPILAGYVVQRHGFPAFLLVAGLLVFLAWLLVLCFVKSDRDHIPDPAH